MDITCKVKTKVKGKGVFGDKVIKDVFEWEKVAAKKDWKPWRSAPSLAEFILHRDGIEEIKDIVRPIIGDDFEFTSAVIEREISLEIYSTGKVHDIGLWGETTGGKTIFIGLDAKVDESFGNSIASRYRRGLNMPASDMPQRITGLLNLFSLMDNSESELLDFNSNLRYQLLHATAGALHQEADICIFFILCFKTISYVYAKGERNKRHLADFVNGIRSKSLDGDIEPIVEIGDYLHRLVEIGEKKLHIVYSEIPYK